VNQSQVWRAGAIFWSVITVLCGVLFARLKWQHGVDFDLTGFFWLIENMGRLSVLLLMIVCAAAAISFWIRWYLSR